MNISNVKVDRRAGAAYIQVGHGDIYRTHSINEDINIDLDRYGQIIGIEYLSLSASFPTSEGLSKSLHLLHEDLVLISEAEKAFN